MNDELLFETRDVGVLRIPIGSQFSADDEYYEVTRIVLDSGIYRLYGTLMTIPELADDVLDRQ